MEDRRDYREERGDAWRDYRSRNRHVFHQPRYMGPSGYRYRAWQPGWRIPSAYYGPRYIIADPWHYRLHRPASGHLRWVRYGDDVLLVDPRNGMIREVIREDRKSKRLNSSHYTATRMPSFAWKKKIKDIN